MLEQNKLSVIVPCYKVEEYIEECLDSLVGQTFKNIEVIMVDDGSPDNTGKILDEYANKYSNFYAVHTKNGGLSAARNAGLEYVTGEYLAFVDSDDYVAPDAYEKLVGSLMQTGSDMASGYVRRFDSTKQYSSSLHERAIPKTIYKTNIRESTFLVYDTTAWNKVYRSKVFLENNLKYPVNLTYEDIPVSMRFHLLAKTVDIISDPIYYWRVRESSNQSITQQRGSFKLFWDRMQTLELAHQAIKELDGGEKLEAAFNYKVLNLDLPIYLNSFQNSNESTLLRFQQDVVKFLRGYDLKDIQRLSIRKQIQYYSLLNGNFKAFKQYGYQYDKLGKVFKKGSQYVYKNDEIPDVISEKVNIADSFELKQTISTLKKRGNKISVKGNFRIKPSVKLPSMDEKFSAVLKNIENQKEMPLNFERVVRTRKRVFFSKKEKIGFKTNFQIIDAIKKLGPGTWQMLVSMDSLNVHVETVLGNPVHMGEQTIKPFEISNSFFSNRYNRDWSLEFKVHSLQNKQLSLMSEQAQIFGPEINNDKLSLKLRTNGEIRHAALAYVEWNKEPKIAELKLQASNNNQEQVYKSTWDLSNLVSDDISNGKIIFMDLDTGARFHYEYLRSVKSEHMQTGNLDINVKFDSLNLIWLTVINEQLKIKNIHFIDEKKISIDFDLPNYIADDSNFDILMVRTDNSERYKNFSKIVKRDEGFHAEIFFTKENHHLIKKGSYNFYLSLSHDKLNKQIMFTWPEKRSKGIALINSDSVRSNIYVNKDAKLVLKETQKWAHADETKSKRSFNYSILYPLMRLLPLQKKTAVFESYWGASFDDNPRAIYEYWYKAHKDYKFIWPVQDMSTEIGGPGIAIKQYSLQYWYYMATSKYFVQNTNFADQYAKRKGQIEVETLHGTFMKKMGFEEPSMKKSSVSAQRGYVKRNSRWDYLISPSNYMNRKVGPAFDYQKRILDVGFPRNDILFNQNTPEFIEKLKEQLNLPKNKKIILYAPTYRQEGVVDFKLDVARLQSELSDDYILLVRLHHLVANAIDLHQFSGFAYDVSAYDNVEELYLLADILITDYSSVMFDYGYLKRPMIFFAYDLNWYKESSHRGVYLDYENTVPGPIVKTTDAIVDWVKNDNKLISDYKNKIQYFYESFCSFGRKGDASKKVVETMINDKLKYPQGYEKNYIGKKFVHSLHVPDLKSLIFNYLGEHLHRKNIIIFESNEGSSYDDSPRAIYEDILKMKNKYRLYWRIKPEEKKYFKQNRIPYVMDTIRGIRVQAQARYWFINNKFPDFWKRPKGAKVVQTGLGTPIKKVGTDVSSDYLMGKTIYQYQKDQVVEARKWNYLVVGNEYGSEILKNAYRLRTNQIVESGLPRNDRLFNATDDSVIRIKDQMGISRDKKVVLYMPTWRDDDALYADKIVQKIRIDVKKISEGLDENTLLMIRFHRHVNGNYSSLKEFGDKVIDATGYPEVSDLYLIGDILISDYSSAIFDFANLKKPIILYVDDWKNYRDNVRGTYLDYETDIHLPITKNTNELMTALKHYLTDNYDAQPFIEFNQKYCLWEKGESTRKLLDYVFNNEKYYVEEENSKIVGKSVIIDDGAIAWSNVYGAPKSKLVVNIDNKAKEKYKIEKVAALYDPINHEQTGERYAAFYLNDDLVWTASGNINM
ncbi:hypothetical protein PESHB5_03690 [Pediococcus parvulus]